MNSADWIIIGSVIIFTAVFTCFALYLFFFTKTYFLKRRIKKERYYNKLKGGILQNNGIQEERRSGTEEPIRASGEDRSNPGVREPDKTDGDDRQSNPGQTIQIPSANTDNELKPNNSRFKGNFRKKFKLHNPTAL